MIIGHMPGGFILSYAMLRKQRQLTGYGWLLLAGLFASILPDLDLFYQHFIDHHLHGHHSYWTHIPIYWVGIYFVMLVLVYKWGQQKLQLLVHVMFAGVMSHMLLDSVTSGIKWLYPFDNHYIGLWRLWLIPSRYDWWVLNYITHWTFIYELALLGISLTILWRDKALCRTVYQLLMRLVPARMSVKRDTAN